MSTLKFEPLAGWRVDHAVEVALEIAQAARQPCDLTFNDTTVKVYPNHRDQVLAIWASKRPDGEPL